MAIASLAAGLIDLCDAHAQDLNAAAVRAGACGLELEGHSGPVTVKRQRHTSKVNANKAKRLAETPLYPTTGEPHTAAAPGRLSGV